VGAVKEDLMVVFETIFDCDLASAQSFQVSLLMVHVAVGSRKLCEIGVTEKLFDTGKGFIMSNDRFLAAAESVK
jgi:hypothetical protein